MKCYHCGNKVPRQKKQCDYCGKDLKMLQKAYNLSDSYYNMGLAKAKVRDLTGAIFTLKKSLEINKNNTNARNLLGLVYFETGEIVSALNEWIISKHIDPDNKTSEYYIDRVQSNPNKLDILDQSIKKYNAALVLAKQGNDDLAIIQLKKATSLNPRFIKAQQLISLLYINNKDYDKAFKHLKRARRIDLSNTKTLKYLKEIETYATDFMAGKKKQTKQERKQENVQAQPFTVSPYKEDKPNIGVFLSLIAGIVIGVIASVILIIPTVKDDAVNQFRDSEVEYNAVISRKDQEISSLDKGNNKLLEQINQLESKLTRVEEALEVETDNTANEKLLEAANLYMDGIINEEMDYVAVADTISAVQLDSLDDSYTINLYNKIKDAVYIDASKILYDEGRDIYSDANYDQALEVFLKSCEYNPTDVNALYFTGRSYHRLQEHDKAKEYYSIIADEYPATRRARDANQRLRELE